MNQDYVNAVPLLPRSFVNLLILDPPYNLTKNFNGQVFRAKEVEEYASWFEGMLLTTIPLLTPSAVSYKHLRAQETVLDLVCRLLLEKKKTEKSETFKDISDKNYEYT